MLDPTDMPTFNPTRLPEPGSREVFGHIVDLDGANFENLHFTRCLVRYGGWEPPKLHGCTFLRSEFVFTGRALNTLKFMQDMAHSGVGGAEFIVQNLLGLNDWAPKDEIPR